jgi:putative SOS response-associated peptidase YedK
VVVPASHFYEWRAVVGPRLPIAISQVDGRVLNLAGLLGRWEDRLATTILTTVPNADIVTLHNRVPVVLNDDDRTSNDEAPRKPCTSPAAPPVLTTV